MPIQVADPWKRMGVLVLGLLLGSLAYVFHWSNGPQWLWLAVGSCSLAFVLWGAFGRRGRLGREINKMPDDWPKIILDAVINAL